MDRINTLRAKPGLWTGLDWTGLDWTGGLDYGLDWTGLIMDSDLDWWCRVNVNNNDDHFNLYKVKPIAI